jgi:hypothetical protein
MNLDNVPTGVSRDVAYVLTMGDSKLWTGIQSINISPYQAPTPVGAVTITSVSLESFSKKLKLYLI